MQTGTILRRVRPAGARDIWCRGQARTRLERARCLGGATAVPDRVRAATRGPVVRCRAEALAGGPRLRHTRRPNDTSAVRSRSPAAVTLPVLRYRDRDAALEGGPRLRHTRCLGSTSAARRRRRYVTLAGGAWLGRVR